MLTVTVLFAGACWAPGISIAHTMSKVEGGLVARVPTAEVLDESLPDFRFEDRTGSVVKLTDFSGTVIVLSFDQRRVPGSCAAIDRVASKARTLVAGAKGLTEQIRFATVIIGEGGDSGFPQSLCESGMSESEPPLELFVRSVPGASNSRFAESHGFGQGVTAGVLVVDASGRIRARFRGPAFEPVELMMFAAALAHGEHGIPEVTKDAEGRTDIDEATIRLSLGGAFGLLGVVTYVLYTRTRSHTCIRKSKGRDG